MNDECRRSLRNVGKQLRMIYETLDIAWNAMESAKVAPDFLGKEKPSEVVKTDLIGFLLYMTASDGVIHDSEVEFLNLLYDLEITPEDCKRCIVEGNIYSEEYERKLPKACAIAISIDHLFGDFMPQSMLEPLIELYKVLGETIAKSDGNFCSAEKRDCTIYINMLKEQSELLKRRITEASSV